MQRQLATFVLLFLVGSAAAFVQSFASFGNGASLRSTDFAPARLSGKSKLPAKKPGVCRLSMAVDDDDEEDDVPLAVKMDALRRMQAYKSRQSGETMLQSGQMKMSETPLEVSVKELRGVIRDIEETEFAGQEAFLLDVRERDEFEFCSLEGATLIPMSEMKTRFDEVPQDKTVFVYCHHGTRSMQVVRYLRTRGWKNVANVAGGIDQWSELVDPAVPRY